MKEKHIRAIDLIVLAVTLVSVLVLVGYARPLAIAPIDNYITTNSSVLFKFEKGGVILIDDNSEFSSPQKIYAENNLVINLKPGIYYWKIEGALSSSVRQLTIESEVELKLRKTTDDGFEIVNAGNTDLNVDIYENGKMKENVVLRIDEGKNVSGTKFIGREGGKNES